MFFVQFYSNENPYYYVFIFIDKIGPISWTYRRGSNQTLSLMGFRILCVLKNYTKKAMKT